MPETPTPTADMLIDAIQSLGEGIALFDENLNFVFCNQTYIELALPKDIDKIPYGRNFREIYTNLAISDTYIIDNDIVVQNWVSDLEKNLRNYQENVELQRSNGQLLLCSSHKTGRHGYLITLSDVTEQRRAEQAEHEADMLLHKIVDACPATFLVSRVKDGKIIYCPPGSRERFGDIDSTLSFFLKPEDRIEYLDALMPTGVLDNYRVRFRRADGSIMDGLTSARVTDYKGEDVIVSSTRDITELLAMQEELEQQRASAHQNEKLSALGSLLAGVAHELNNPLSIIVGYAMMLQDKAEDPEVKRRVDRIAQSAERCSRIVKTFLAMARQQPTQIQQCAINDVLDDALDITHYNLRAAGIEVKKELSTDLPPVSIDSDQMVQVFTNLIINAEHALVEKRSPGRIILRSSYQVDSNQIIIEVEDNGAGIEEQNLPRIFEPFFTTREQGVGTGVGLAYCHRIISAHDGKISVTSSEGKGACFSVCLNISDDTQLSNTQTTDKNISDKRGNILVIDDETDVANMFSELLGDIGYSVSVLHDARKALELLSSNNFDVILCDVKMPDMDGLDFLEAIQRDFPQYQSRLGFITGDSLSSRAAKLLNGKSCAYLEKPVAPEALYEFVDQLLDQPEK